MNIKETMESIKMKEKLNLKEIITPPTFEEWKTKVEADLKGALFEKRLITKTYEDIELQPIYTKKDVGGLKLQNEFPGIKNFKRNSNTTGYFKKAWNINQNIKIADVKKFNTSLKTALANGQNCINITIDTATKLGLNASEAESKQVGDLGLSISTLKDLENALEGVDITKFPIIIEGGFNLLPLLFAFAQKQNINLKDLSGVITADPFALLVEQTKLPFSIKSIFDNLGYAIKWTKSKKLKIKLIEVSTLPYSNGGANAVQEIAFAMATATDYINSLQERKVKAIDVINNIVFTFGISTNYFMEIAKFRAARILWNNIAEAYGVPSQKLDIHFNAKTSSYYQTIFDPYVNMLRTTTEAFSAILGGVESITTAPFDDLFAYHSDFSGRLARNTQIILKEESHLDKVIDAAGGSFYIETLTKQLAEKSWELFKTIEDKGGMFNSVKEGYVQELVSEVAEKRKKDVNKRKSVIVGTNMFANLKEEKPKTKRINQKYFRKKRIEQLENHRKDISSKEYKSALKELDTFNKSSSQEIIEAEINAFLKGATIGEVSKYIFTKEKEIENIPKLNNKRAAEGFENLRNISLNIKKKTGSYPKVFLATMGTLKEYKPRADFSRGFFEVGGFEVIYSEGFNDVKLAIKEAFKQKAKAIVICSTDDNYNKLVPEFTKEMKNKKSRIPLILAGYPKDKIEEYKNLGIDEFIFLSADAYEILSSLLKKIGGGK